MKENFSWLTPKQASELVGYTPRHIQNLITSGKLPATKEDGKYYIEKSEFFRLYPKAYKKSQEGSTTQQVAEKQILEFENTMLKEIKISQQKEIEFLRVQMESMSKEKEKLLEIFSDAAKSLTVKHTNILDKLKEWKILGSFKKDNE